MCIVSRCLPLFRREAQMYQWVFDFSSPTSTSVKYRVFYPLSMFSTLLTYATTELDCSLFFFNKFIYFIYFWLRWVFIAVCRLSPVAVNRGYSSLRCMGFSLRWLLLLRGTGSRCAGFSSCSTPALGHRLSSCGPRA